MSWHDITDFLPDVLLRGAIILSLAMCVVVMLRKAAAAVKHLILLVAFGLLLLLPILLFLSPKWHPFPQKVWFAAAPIVQHHAAANSPSAPISGAVSQNPAGAGSPHKSITVLDVLAIAWIAGIVLCLLPVMVGIYSLQRRARRWLELSNGSAWGQSLVTARQQSGVRGKVRLLAGDDCQTPMTFGILRPTIVVPAHTEHWPEQRRRAVLLHELAHVRRKDCLVSCFARIACAIHWPNPLPWLALKRLDAERERACDDAVLDRGTPKEGYANELLAVAQAASAVRSVFAVEFCRESTLEARMENIMSHGHRRRGVRIILSVGVVAVGCAMIIPVATLRAGDERPKSATTESVPPDDTVVQVVRHVRDVAMLALEFANDHGGKLPHSLGETLPDVFGRRVSTSGTVNSVWASLYLTPADLRAHPAPPLITPDWINQHMSYDYLCPDVPVSKLPSPCLTIIFHTKLDHPIQDPPFRNRILAAYADGHVEALPVDEAKKEIEETKQVIKELRAASRPSK
jgi:beta-lactamase regulating signal transducer with metallopeptidase domain